MPLTPSPLYYPLFFHDNFLKPILQNLYALKYINKPKCIKMRAVSNIIQERRLLEEIESPFVCNLRVSLIGSSQDVEKDLLRRLEVEARKRQNNSRQTKQGLDSFYEVEPSSRSLMPIFLLSTSLSTPFKMTRTCSWFQISCQEEI